jgi:hypothetical protein
VQSLVVQQRRLKPPVWQTFAVQVLVTQLLLAVQYVPALPLAHLLPEHLPE